MSDEALSELGESISRIRNECVRNWDVSFGELNVDVALSNIVPFVEYLKTDPNCKFSTLVDITAVDYPGRQRRFDVVYHLLSMYQNQRIRLRVAVREEDMVPSITGVHPSANWFEREVFDMFGILFSGHPDLRRILTDYGFRGYPLRKDFPTTGLHGGSLRRVAETRGLRTGEPRAGVSPVRFHEPVGGCGLHPARGREDGRAVLMEGFLWVIVAVLTVIPMLKLLPHFGIHKWWALAGIIPLGVLGLLWWMSIKLQEMEER